MMHSLGERSRSCIRLPEGDGMSLTIFLAVCVLGLDFMIYLFCQWTFGDKRKVIARAVAEQRELMEGIGRRPYLVMSEKRL